MDYCCDAPSSVLSLDCPQMTGARRPAGSAPHLLVLSLKIPLEPLGQLLVPLPGGGLEKGPDDCQLIFPILHLQEE